MRKHFIFPFLWGLALFCHNSTKAHGFDFISSFFESRKYALDGGEESRYEFCQSKYGSQKNSDDEEAYYVSCAKDGALKTSAEIEKLNGQVQSISVGMLEDDFLSGLKKNLLSTLKEREVELAQLIACIETKEKTGEKSQCAEKLNGLVHGVRSDLPKARLLLAQMNMPGKIYSPTKPERFERELASPLSKLEFKGLSKDEASFLAKHTDMLETKFREDIISKDPDLENCIDKNPCQGKEGLISAKISKMFEKQNLAYQTEYARLTGRNPLLALLNVRGTESIEEILESAGSSLRFLKKRVRNSIEKIEKMKGSERIDLMALGLGVEKELERKDSKIYCDIANGLSQDLDFEELKTDALLGAGALIGGGVCGMTFGAGCALSVAVGAEALSLANDHMRYLDAQDFYYSGEGDGARLEEKDSAKQMGLYLAPLSIIGSGAGKVVKKLSGKRISRNVSTLNSLKGSLPLKNRILDLYNPGNKLGLSVEDQEHLAGIVEILLKRKKQNLGDIPDQEILERVTAIANKCQGKK